MQLFLSYARTSENFAKDLREWLLGAGFNVWLDVRDIGAGLWETQVRQNVAGSDAVLVILTPDSVKSAQVRKEWELARATNKIIIPILLKECEVPPELKTYQWIDFRAA